MNVLADIILPALTGPFLFTLFFPLATFTVLAIEVAVLRLLNRDLSWRRIVGIVIVINLVSTVPESRQIKITRFYGVHIKEHTFEFVDGQLREVDSKYVYDHVDGEFRWIGPRPPSQGRLPKGCDTFPVYAKGQAAFPQDPP